MHQKNINFATFTNNIWPYLLRFPIRVVDGKRSIHPMVTKYAQAQNVAIPCVLKAREKARLHPARLVQAMSVWSVNTRRTPSRHYGDATVLRSYATAMHDMSAPLSRPLVPSNPSVVARLRLAYHAA